MKHIRGLLSPSQALRRVFFSSVQGPRIPLLHSPLPQVPSTPARSLPSLRFFRPPPRTSSTSPSSATDQVKDEGIQSEFVHVVNEQGDLEPPQKLFRVLEKLNRPNEFLLQVAPAGRGKPPICKVMNRIAVREHERSRAKAARAAKSSLKQVELNWAIDRHDLSHRLKQMANFLDKGRKVEVILTRKRGKRAPTPEEVQHVMDSVMETIQTANAALVKPREGQPGKQVTLVVKKKE